MSSAHACARFDRSCMVSISLTWSRKSEQIPNSQPLNVKLISNVCNISKTPIYSNVEICWMSFIFKNSPVSPSQATGGGNAFEAARTSIFSRCAWMDVDGKFTRMGGSAKLWARWPLGWGNDKYLFIHPFNFQVPTFWSTNGICEDHWQNARQGIDGPWIGID